MLRLPLLTLLLYYGVAQAFVGAPTQLGARGNAVYTKGWGTGIPLHTRAAAVRGASQRCASGSQVAPRMSLMLLAEGDVPISSEQQDIAISALSVASSGLLLIIIAGAVYLSLAEWRNKKELEKSEKTIASTGELPPEMLPEGVSKGDSEEEGNRLYRRRVKKERQKDGSTP